MVCIAPGGGAAVGGSLRLSLSGSRPTSHSQGHGRPCLPRPHLLPRFHLFSIPSGAIRTNSETAELTEYQSFNSIKVQLEHLRVDTPDVLMRNPHISHMLNFPLHIEASYSLLIRSTNSSGVSISIFEKPNHFLPKSLMDAPM